jgi:hypothetical protein
MFCCNYAVLFDLCRLCMAVSGPVNGASMEVNGQSTGCG